jgi:hypothetical protein
MMPFSQKSDFFKLTKICYHVKGNIIKRLQPYPINLLGLVIENANMPDVPRSS